jgi:hypothetical protein
VLDAGTTATGRPYFVMELVKGVPITEYCDTNHLTLRERLELFVPVCQAIQHAHQKGIIHRDIKPSNVLVTLHDGTPVPKVIDFGLAKAIDQRLTERTLFTQLGQFIGTPEYMSPEQAGLSGLDIDTRSDIYALGVLLYELLTGSTPLQRAKLRQAAFSEILRRIREEEPPRPSTRLSTTEELPTIAANRKTEPAKLARLVRGELDWIVMKCLEKDRTRRYESASGLARDIRRHLDGDPVEAGPPSATYRLRKYARKHRAALITVGAFAALLLIATAASTVLAIAASRARDAARKALGETSRQKAKAEEALAQSEAVRNFLVSAFRSPDPSEDGRTVTMFDLLDRAADQLDKKFDGSPVTKGALLDALGQTYLGLGIWDRAQSMFTKSATVREAALGPDHPDTLASRHNIAITDHAVGRPADAIKRQEETLRQEEKILGPDHPNVLSSRNSLGAYYRAVGRTA